MNLLKTILDELYACRFGTFLYNSEKERADLVGARVQLAPSMRSHFVGSENDDRLTLVARS